MEVEEHCWYKMEIEIQENMTRDVHSVSCFVNAVVVMRWCVAHEDTQIRALEEFMLHVGLKWRKVEITKGVELKVIPSLLEEILSWWLKIHELCRHKIDEIISSVKWLHSVARRDKRLSRQSKAGFHQMSNFLLDSTFMEYVGRKDNGQYHESQDNCEK